LRQSVNQLFRWDHSSLSKAGNRQNNLFWLV
jgi:hypothetical protein